MNNGAFELGDGTPFWTFYPNQNRYSITPSDGVAGFLTTELISDTPFKFTQEFGKNKQGVFDFPAPAPAGIRSSIAAGYAVEEAKVLPQGSYTLFMQVRSSFGDAIITPVIEGPGVSSGTTVPVTAEFEGPSVVRVSGTEWATVVFRFTVTSRIYRVGFSIIRDQLQTHARVSFTKCGLVVGAYDQAVYTGDVLARSLPKGAIVLSLGKACPDGFALLEEGNPPAAWVSDEPTIKLKHGNFPAAVDGPAGDVLHTSVSLFQQEDPGIVLFDGFDSKIYVERNSLFSTTGSSGRVDVPDRDGQASHEHEIKKAKAVPVSVNFLLCKRL